MRSLPRCFTSSPSLSVVAVVSFDLAEVDDDG